MMWEDDLARSSSRLAMQTLSTQTRLRCQRHWRCGRRDEDMQRWARCGRWPHMGHLLWAGRIHCLPVPRDWNIVGNAVHNHDVGKAGRQLVLEQDQPVGRAEHTDAIVPLRCPVAYYRIIAWIPKLGGVVGEYTARAADGVRQQKQLGGWSIYPWAVMSQAAPIASQALVTGNTQHHHEVSEAS